MNEREELKAEIKAVVKRLQPYEVEALAAHLERVGFRKTLDLEELERWEYGAHGHGDGDTLDRATGAPDDRDLVKLSDLRRLAASKERWVLVAERLPTLEELLHSPRPGVFSVRLENGRTYCATLHLKDRYTPETHFRPFTEDLFNEETQSWQVFSDTHKAKVWAVGFNSPVVEWRSIPPPPTNPAQTAKEPCPICGGTGVDTDLIEQCFACKGTRVATPAQREGS